MAGWLIQAGHIGLHQPVTERPEVTVTVPGVVMEADAVEARAELVDITHYTKPVALEIKPLEAAKVMEGS